MTLAGVSREGASDLLGAVEDDHRAIHIQCHLLEGNVPNEVLQYCREDFLVARLPELVEKPPVAAPLWSLLPCKECFGSVVAP